MNKRKEYLEGKVFNYLLVKQYVGDCNYLCECLNCGKKTVASATRLKNGRKKSCGCMRYELISKSNTKHGDSYSRLYREFYGMHNRCYNCCDPVTQKIYKDRGITVCDEWYNNYPAFKEWSLSNGYDDGLTIDRIDNNKGYSPDNCRWITQLEQASNKRNNIYITIGEETHSMSEWCRINGISYTSAGKRIREYGWDPVRAVTQPNRKYVKKNTSKVIGT